jgi:hypothetical protein
MTVKQLITHLLECDLNAEVMIEGMEVSSGELKTGAIVPIDGVERGWFPTTNKNWVKIKGTPLWHQNRPIEGKHTSSS